MKSLFSIFSFISFIAVVSIAVWWTMQALQQTTPKDTMPPDSKNTSVLDSIQDAENAKKAIESRHAVPEGL